MSLMGGGGKGQGYDITDGYVHVYIIDEGGRGEYDAWREGTPVN